MALDRRGFLKMLGVAALSPGLVKTVAKPEEIQQMAKIDKVKGNKDSAVIRGYLRGFSVEHSIDSLPEAKVEMILTDVLQPEFFSKDFSGELTVYIVPKSRRG